MTQLYKKVQLYAKANGVNSIDFLSDVKLQDDVIDGVSSPYIKEWNLGIAEPTAEQLATYEDEANAEESNQAVKPYIAKRKAAYPPIGDQLDYLWHSIDKNPDLKTQYFDFYEAIKAVKVKYGKDD